MKGDTFIHFSRAEGGREAWLVQQFDEKTKITGANDFFWFCLRIDDWRWKLCTSWVRSVCFDERSFLQRRWGKRCMYNKQSEGVE